MTGVQTCALPISDDVFYTRDRDGLIINRQVSGGSSVELRRGPEGLIDEIVTTDGSTRFEYEHGRPAAAVTATGIRTSLDYDGPRLAALERSGNAQGRIEFEHSAGFRLERMRAGELVLDVRHDLDGLIVGLGPVEIVRDGLGRATTVLAGPTTMTDAYDDAGRLIARTVLVDGRTVWQIGYTYDTSGRIESIDDRAFDGTQRFRYDQVGRLLECSGSAPCSAAYDDGGAMLSMGTGGVITESRSDTSDRVVRAGDHVIEYGPGGVMETVRSSATSRTYRWDALGRLVGADDVTYSRDGFGALSSITPARGAPLRLLAGTDGRVFATLDDDGAAERLFGRESPWDLPLVAVQHDRDLLIVGDHVGSPRLAIDVESGEVIEQRAFDVWGQEVRRDGDAALPFGFAGGVDDRVTGLVHFPARTYDPTLRTWLSRDPRLFLGGSLNLYSYCDNDPVNHRDPTGRDVHGRVQLCRRPAQVDGYQPEGSEHWWMKTDNNEAGMGPKPDPGDYEINPTVITDHTGNAATDKSAVCDDVINVDQDCVDKALENIGQSLGAFLPLVNTCQNFVEDVLDACSGGDYEIVTKDPDAYDNWYSPDVSVAPYSPVPDEPIMSEDPGQSAWD